MLKVLVKGVNVLSLTVINGLSTTSATASLAAILTIMAFTEEDEFLIRV